MSTLSAIGGHKHMRGNYKLKIQGKGIMNTLNAFLISTGSCGLLYIHHLTNWISCFFKVITPSLSLLVLFYKEDLYPTFQIQTVTFWLPIMPTNVPGTFPCTSSPKMPPMMSDRWVSTLGLCSLTWQPVSDPSLLVWLPVFLPRFSVLLLFMIV